MEKHALYLCDQGGIDYPSNFYREASIPRRLRLPGEIANVENGADSDSSKFQNNLTTDELFELVGGEEFDDSGFS